MKIKKEILTVMHETLPCYLVLQVGAKLANHMRGHLRALQAISCISYGLLYDWPSHLRERIKVDKPYFSVQELSWEVLLFFLMYPWK